MLTKTYMMSKVKMLTELEYLSFLDWCYKHGMMVGKEEKVNRALTLWNEIYDAVQRGISELQPTTKREVEMLYDQVHGHDMYEVFAFKAGVKLPEKIGYVTYLYFDEGDTPRQLYYYNVNSREEAIGKMSLEMPRDKFADVSEVKFMYPFERRI